MAPLHPDVQVHQIQAAVLRKKGGPLKIESLELEGPRDDEVLIRIIASGICHTDIDMCDSWGSADGPVVLGHEGAGVVEQVGRRVKVLIPIRFPKSELRGKLLCKEVSPQPPSRNSITLWLAGFLSKETGKPEHE